MDNTLKAKDYFEMDLYTFLNLDVFGEIHKISDVETVILIDNEILKERQIKSAEGTYIGDVLFYVKKSDLKIKPKVNNPLKLDGEMYFISKVSDEDGLYEIVLGSNRSR